MAVKVVVPSRYDDFFNPFMSSLVESQLGSTAAVIVMDNGLSQRTRDRWPQAQFIKVPGDPFRYAHSINLGVQAAAPHDTLILGDDMQMITDNWLDEVTMFLRRWPAGFGSMNLLGNVEVIPGEYLESKTALGLGITIIPRKTWDMVGPWDERYDGGYGYEDMDYCVQQWHRGLKIGTCTVARLKHTGSETWKRVLGSYEGVIKACLSSHDVFYEKWGMQPKPNREIHFIEASEHLEGRCQCRR